MRQQPSWSEPLGMLGEGNWGRGVGEVLRGESKKKWEKSSVPFSFRLLLRRPLVLLFLLFLSLSLSLCVCVCLCVSFFK